MQCSEQVDEEFGWDCMLGKLCRLAKRCQRATTTAPRATQRLQSANQISTDIHVNYMLHPSGVWSALQRNNALTPRDALRQHALEKL